MQKILMVVAVVAFSVPTAFAADVAAGQARFSSTCASCHGANAEGIASFPKLAGKSASELISKLKKYRAGEAVGPLSSMMFGMAAGLSDADIDNIAAFVSSK